MEDNHSDKVFIRTVGSTISKISLFICLSVVLGMTINTCNVDEEIIKQCQESCRSSGGMKEVTGTSCECTENIIQNSSSQWVIPR